MSRAILSAKFRDPQPAVKSESQKGLLPAGSVLRITGDFELAFTLPFPPTANTYYRCIVGRSVKLSKKGRIYRQQVALQLMLDGLTCSGISGQVAVHLTLCPPDRSKRDVDNYQKAPLDALTHAQVWHDDAQCRDLHTVFGSVVKGGALHVRITPHQPQEETP